MDSPKFSTICSLKTIIFVPFSFEKIVVSSAVCLDTMEEFIVLSLEEKCPNGIVF